MARIDRFSNILEIIRRRTEGSDDARGTRKRTAAGKAIRNRESPNTLRESLHARLSKLDLAQPQEAQRARTVFLEQVLAWEFGATAPADPRFHNIVARVGEAIATDPELSLQLDQLVADLQRGTES